LTGGANSLNLNPAMLPSLSPAGSAAQEKKAGHSGGTEYPAESIS
jgi:hypothetical protein